MKRKKSKFTLPLIVILLLILLVAILPTLASPSWLTWYGKRKGLDITAESLSLKWFGPQTIKGLVVRDPPKGLQISSEELKCIRSLFALIFSRCNDLDVSQASALLQLPQIEPVRFDNIEMKVRWPEELVASGQTSSGNFNIKIEKFPHDLDAEAHFSQFPVYAIDRLLAMYLPKSEGLLLELIGPTADLDLNLDTEGEKQQLVLTARSDHFSANVRTAYKNDRLTLEQPATFRFQVTPKLLELLGVKDLLTAPIPVSLELSEFQFPYFTLSMSSPDFVLKESQFKVGKEIVLQNPTTLDVSTAIQSPYFQLPKPFTLSIQELKFPHLSAKASALLPQLLIGGIPVSNAQVLVDVKEGETASLHLKSDTLSATVKAILGESIAVDARGSQFEHDLTLRANYEVKDETLDATFSAKSASGRAQLEIEKKGDIISGKVEMEKFASSFLDRLIPGYHLRAWLGPSVSANGKFDLDHHSGPLHLRLHSTNARFSLDGSLDLGILRLKEPFYAQLNLTSELAPLLLEEVNPLSVPTFSSENPLTLEIASENSSIPLIPFNPSQLNISKARLELGQIVCENVGNLHLALGLLQQQVSGNQPLHLWFAPAVLSISNGVASLERTELLIDKRLAVCTWGEVNLPGDSVRMVLGLPAPTLKKVFGLKNLPENYVLQLPMRGPLNNVQIDSSKATGKITALMLWQKASAAGAMGGGLPGAIVGELFGKVVPLPDGDKKAPPAKRPFPWEQEKLRSEKPKSEKGIKFKKEEEDALPLLKFVLPS